MSKKIDYLEEDPIINGQKYVLFSFVSQKHIKNAKVNAFKFRGAFPDEQSAKDYAKKLQEMDGDFHIYIGEGFKWLPYDPDDDTIEDHEYYEKELNNIMKSHKEQLFEKKKIEKDRKDQLIKESYEETKQPQNDTQKRLREKMANKKLNELIDDKKGKEIEDSSKNIETLNSGLNKLQEVYKKLQEKQKENNNKK